jgi:hypothetical protein
MGATLVRNSLNVGRRALRWVRTCNELATTLAGEDLNLPDPDSGGCRELLTATLMEELVITEAGKIPRLLGSCISLAPDTLQFNLQLKKNRRAPPS